ncbi:acetolactate decarboxylase [Pantoea tagorei]
MILTRLNYWFVRHTMCNFVSDCSCEDQLKDTLDKLAEKSPEKVIYQTSLMSALLSGVYDGSTTVADLLRKGDFGLGTFNQLDGELIAFDSEVYQLRSDGSARPARPEQKNAFCGNDFFQT